MTKIENLANWPSKKATRWGIFLCLLLLFVVSPIMNYYATLSGLEDIIASELSFSGPSLKEDYQAVLAVDGMEAFRISQILDYLFMVAYGGGLFFLSLAIARKFEKDSFNQKSGYWNAILGVGSALLDVVENAFFLLSIEDPTGFPDWWAVALSSFSIVKWVLVLIAILWVIIWGVLSLIKYRK
jgi:hypothetical protein